VTQLRTADGTFRYRAVIYLLGQDSAQLDETEQRCRAHAAEFGWQVLRCLRDSDGTALARLLTELSDLDVRIVLTGTLDMISPDYEAAIERSQCIVHPVCIPCREGRAADVAV
jgi:hypothetical protein